MSPAHPTEQRFEDHITDHLVASGYTQRLPSSYDKALCLIPEDVIAFVQATQPDQWQQLERQYGTAKETGRRLCERLQSQIERKGTLEILRKGIETRGCKFKLAYFRPSSGMNPDHLAKYRQNRFVVIRQAQRRPARLPPHSGNLHWQHSPAASGGRTPRHLCRRI